MAIMFWPTRQGKCVQFPGRALRAKGHFLPVFIFLFILAGLQTWQWPRLGPEMPRNMLNNGNSLRMRKKKDRRNPTPGNSKAWRGHSGQLQVLPARRMSVYLTEAPSIQSWVSGSWTIFYLREGHSSLTCHTIQQMLLMQPACAREIKRR